MGIIERAENTKFNIGSKIEAFKGLARLCLPTSSTPNIDAGTNNFERNAVTADNENLTITEAACFLAVDGLRQAVKKVRGLARPPA